MCKTKTMYTLHESLVEWHESTSYLAEAAWARAERLSCRGGAAARSRRWSVALLSPPRRDSTPWWCLASWFSSAIYNFTKWQAFQQFQRQISSPDSNVIVQIKSEKEFPCRALGRESKPEIVNTPNISAADIKRQSNVTANRILCFISLRKATDPSDLITPLQTVCIAYLAFNVESQYNTVTSVPL